MYEREFGSPPAEFRAEVPEAATPLTVAQQIRERLRDAHSTEMDERTYEQWRLIALAGQSVASARRRRLTSHL